MPALRPSLLLCPIALVCLSIATAQQPLTPEQILGFVKGGEAIGKDFSGVHAPGLNLARCNLTATVWRNADLRGAGFLDLSLQKANLQAANLRGATFERVDLLGADLSGADLSGAVFCLVSLENANLTGCRLDGTLFEGAGFSLTGAPHFVVLHLALQQATGQQISRPWVAAMSGDAFAFCYNRQEPSQWPGVPFTVNPMVAAPQNMGLQATFTKEDAAQKALLDRDQEKSIQILALKLPGVNECLTQGKPVWALLTARDAGEAGNDYKFQAPPFGEHELRRDQVLTEYWGGPWETPEPAGMLPARKQLVTIVPGVMQPAPDQVLKALRQAVTIITEKRTYGPLVPGEAGLTQLAADLRTACKSLDSELARRLLPWQRFPRQCLIGSLGLAADFLAEAGPQLPEDKQASCQEARLLLRSAMVSLDTGWPQLTAGVEALTPDQSEAFAAAADIVAEVAAAERKAAELFAGIAQ